MEYLKDYLIIVLAIVVTVLVIVTIVNEIMLNAKISKDFKVSDFETKEDPKFVSNHQNLELFENRDACTN